MGLRWSELVIDCVDPAPVAAFWAAALGLPPPEADADGDYELAPPGGGPVLLFQHVPEPKTVKDRLHIDLSPTGGASEQQAEVERLLALGAARVDIGQGQPSWVVLADPEGNEFCVLRGDDPAGQPG